MNTRMSTFLLGAGVILAIAAAGAGLYYWKFERPAAKTQPPGFEPAQAVQVVAAREAQWHPTSRLFGSVVAVQSITVSNELAGVITDVKFESGSIVQKGDVLLQQDVSTEEADLAAARANVTMMDANIHSAQAQIEWYEYNMNRLNGMEPGVVAPNEYAQAHSQLETARGQLDRARAEAEAARARVAQIEATIAKKTIKAPFAAHTGLRNVHPGQYLAEGTSIVSLQGISDEIYVDFAVPQEYAALVKPGDTVTARSDVLGSDDARIEVVAMDAVADYTTRNVRVRAKIANKEQRLRPGMFIDVTVAVGSDQSYVVVPSTAIRRASFGDHVFVIAPNPEKPEELRAQQRFVKLGPSVGSDVIVANGLKAGEEIAAAGSFKLRNNALVAKQTPDADPAPVEKPGASAADEKSDRRTMTASAGT